MSTASSKVSKNIYNNVVPNLSTLSDIFLSTPTNNQVLTYSDSTSKWQRYYRNRIYIAALSHYKHCSF